MMILLLLNGKESARKVQRKCKEDVGYLACACVGLWARPEGQRHPFGADNHVRL